MTRLALLADTHLTSYDGGLGEELAAHLEGVDLILHAGDVYASSVLDWLEAFAPVVVARGNGDETLGNDRRVENTQVLEVGGITIGARHWFAYPPYRDGTFTQQVRDAFGKSVDVVVFGDTHLPVIVRHGEILLINPGSPTIPGQRLQTPGTLAILEVNGEGARASFIHLQQAIPLKMFGNREPLVRPPR